MKRSSLYLTILVSSFLSSCQTSDKDKEDLTEQSKKEIMQAEKDFETMAAEKGIAEAFWFYADSNAVIKRQNDTLIHGKEQIKQYYSADFYKAATVKWTPDFVDASSNADVGYTYGKYTWQSKDSTGKPIEFKGVFHTVWKKQNNGEWKYVWD
ncbi:MAG: YybH family protein [Chitinophagales bacterium]